MRVNGCGECEKLPTIKVSQKDKQKALLWIKHFASKPNLMNMASCQTLIKILRITPEELKR